MVVDDEEEEDDYLERCDVDDCITFALVLISWLLLFSLLFVLNSCKRFRCNDTYVRLFILVLITILFSLLVAAEVFLIFPFT